MKTEFSIMVRWCPLPSHKRTEINLSYYGITESSTPLSMFITHTSHTLSSCLYFILYVSITIFYPLIFFSNLQVHLFVFPYTHRLSVLQAGSVFMFVRFYLSFSLSCSPLVFTVSDQLSRSIFALHLCLPMYKMLWNKCCEIINITQLISYYGIKGAACSIIGAHHPHLGKKGFVQKSWIELDF